MDEQRSVETDPAEQGTRVFDLLSELEVGVDGVSTEDVRQLLGERVVEHEVEGVLGDALADERLRIGTSRIDSSSKPRSRTRPASLRACSVWWPG